MELPEAIHISKKYMSEGELLKAVDYVVFTQEELQQGLSDGGAKNTFARSRESEGFS